MVREVDQMEEMLEAIRADIEQTIMRFRNRPTSGGFSADMMSAYVVKASMLEYQILQCKLALIDKQVEMEDALERLPSKERQLIRYRYVYGLTWEQVAQRMRYSVDNVYKIHGVALQKLKKSTVQYSKNVI